MVRARLRILILLLTFPFCIAFGRLAVLQLMPSLHRDALRESRQLSIRPLAPERGHILARDGEVLAGNVPTYEIQFVYSRLNPRDRLVEILADELGETFESFYRREKIEARILELARPEELATRPEPPDVLEPVPSETEDANATACDDKDDDKEWIFLIGSIHRDVKRRIVGRWNKSGTLHRSYLKFCSSANADYFDLWFSREDIVRQEIVLLRLARGLASGDSSRWQMEYDRLSDRVREVRAGYEKRIEKDVGPAPKNAVAHAYRYLKWKTHADTTRSQYHRWVRVLVKRVSLDVVTAVEMYPASFTGLSTRSGSRRVYPENEVCGSLLGYLGLLAPKEAKKLREADLLVEPYFRDNDDLQGFDRIRSELRSLQDRTGANGLERYYDVELRGLYGGIEIQQDRRHNRRTVLRRRPAVDGKDITTTIDLPLQRSLHEELTRVSGGTSSYGGNAASAVVIDVRTGALLACVGVPSIDPNRMREPDYHGELRARWAGQTRSWLWDRPTRYPLAPGSVFKIVLAAAAIETAAETGFSPRTTAYPCKFEFPHFKIHCSARYGHGLEQVNLVQALKHSCNIYFFSIGHLLLKPQRIEPWARRFGFGRSPGIDLGGGGQIGRLDAADDIEKVGVCHYSIGQVHVEATPLQVARSLSVIASGGELPRPYLVKPTGPPETVKFANPDTLKLINDGLWRAAHEAGGTAAKPALGLRAFRVALKTGTAEVLRAGEKLNHAWLAGYAPATSDGDLRNDPRVRARIAFAVVVEETRGHGAEVCAPVVRRLLEHFASTDPDAYSLDGKIRQTAGD